MQGVQHLAHAMGSYIRMGGVAFHELSPPAPSEDPGSSTGNGVKANASSTAPVIESDAVTISAVVLEASADASPPGKAAGEQQAWLPNKRQRTDEAATATLQVVMCTMLSHSS